MVTKKIRDLRFGEIRWICPGFFVNDKRRYVTVKTAWIKGYEQALLDISEGKIKLEEEK